ncbi:phosphate ABC transporter permease subunit PstC [Halopenitus persicus]|uniref:Phosphate transport system permease protein n=1 Tax=Halopenitus persicus TaxID=1048396 RepID=A0A1H3M0M5_9EURY|nr:phosphate ABC transporter permease subunit PstC [Halopenitus persicus]QHS18169.1 phosphate ABC transporter permease subunit PstC [haloarchaeon 3A1-DGR]SDY69799.1 phosphate ABC transporter membrane protein 1, PhoT family [Halopenitus persicus]
MTASTAIGERSDRERRIGRVVKGVFLACAVLTVLITVGIIFTLLRDATTFFAQVPVADFLTGTEWKPTQLTGDGEYKFGVLPLLSGTILITVVSAVIALPTGLAAALYLSEFASETTRSVLKPALEILAGIPTIVYGYFALVYITPFLEWIGLPVETFNALSASIVVGVMIIPMVSSISEDALSAVPDDLRQAAYGLGSTKFDTSVRVVVPAAVSGIFSSFVLALSRAIGETMAVTVAAGQTPRMLSILEIDQNLLQSSETITAAMVNVAHAEGGGGTPAYYSMFALGLVLFVFTFSLNIGAEIIRDRLREEYQ